jgi:glycosyltransferase involved in cell wall biosynthesis
LTAVTDRQPRLGGDLVVHLDAPLPGTVAVGGGTAVFVCGTCVSPRGRPASLVLVVDGAEQPLMAHGMPRIDLVREHGTAAYRSGFWGLARIHPRPGSEPCAVGLRARFEDGAEATAELGRIAIAAPPAPVSDAPPEVAICMATYEPPLELFRRQIETIRAQTHRDWLCIVSDDGSSPGRLAAVEGVLGGDERFVLSRSERRLGFYRNFERALSLAPAGARYVTMADQDDAWHADKLATLVAAIGGAQLVYSDQRIVGTDGRLVAGTYWGLRRNNHADMASLLVTNAVTGAAALFPRALLDAALPFPPHQFEHFHDHWIALCALALGEIRYVDRPLYDYVQHERAFVGHARANRMPSLRERLASQRISGRERMRIWRMHYFVDSCRLMQFAAVLELRCGDRMDPAKRRALERLARADRSVVPLARLAFDGAREILGQRRETLGGEWMLLHAFGWRHLVDANVRDRPQRRLRLDALPPITTLNERDPG